LLINLDGGKMSDQTLQKQILDQLSKLPIEQQHRVLDFARRLAGTSPAGRSGRELLNFAGTIPISDLNMMSQAIEEGCEQVNLNEW
jgi:hypothetical protein